VATGSLATPRYYHTARMLADGRVLIAGGSRDDMALDTAEIWDPETGTFTSAATLTTARTLHTATLLGDGRVLFVGGFGDVASAELWDPATGSFEPAGTMAEGRAWHTATRLEDGRVLIAGGPAGAEIWNPRTLRFSAAGTLAESRWWASATLLSDGRIAVIGGGAGAHFSSASDSLATVEVWDPARLEFTSGDALAVRRLGHTATPLVSGGILVVGGLEQFSSGGLTLLASTEAWSGAGPSPGPGAQLLEPRFGHTTTVLPDGRLLLAGGAAEGDDVTASTELLSPASLNSGP
jgi:Kelch motif protein